MRIIILTLALALAMFTGLVDGLMRRDLRKFGAGRESNLIYHRAKGLLTPLLVTPLDSLPSAAGEPQPYVSCCPVPPCKGQLWQSRRRRSRNICEAYLVESSGDEEQKSSIAWLGLLDGCAIIKGKEPLRYATVGKSARP